MMAPRRSAWREAIWRNRSEASGSLIAPSLSVSKNPLIEVIGVLSSWETFATNSRRIASSRLSRVTSLSTTTAPMRLPLGRQ